jgi:hypothetical protein
LHLVEYFSRFRLSVWRISSSGHTHIAGLRRLPKRWAFEIEAGSLCSVVLKDCIERYDIVYDLCAFSCASC